MASSLAPTTLHINGLGPQAHGPMGSTRADEAIISVRDLSLWLGHHPVLSQVNFTCHAGEFHALIGHNGAGKSSLAGVIAGRLKGSSGQVTHRGSIAVVTQHPRIILDKPVASTVWLGREPAGWFGINRRKMVADTDVLAKEYGIDLGLVGIDPAQPGHTLSPAQSHIVALLAALASEPRVVIADEVTVGASLDTRLMVTDALASVVQHGMGVVMITHFADEVMRAAHRVSVCYRGAVYGPIRTQDVDASWIRAAMAGDHHQLATVIPERSGGHQAGGGVPLLGGGRRPDHAASAVSLGMARGALVHGGPAQGVPAQDGSAQDGSAQHGSAQHVTTQDAAGLSAPVDGLPHDGLPSDGVNDDDGSARGRSVANRQVLDLSGHTLDPRGRAGDEDPALALDPCDGADNGSSAPGQSLASAAQDGAASVSAKGLELFTPVGRVCIAPGEIGVIQGDPGPCVDRLWQTLTARAPSQEWTMNWAGECLNASTIGQLAKTGFAWVGADRDHQGLAPDLSVQANMAAANPGPPLWWHGLRLPFAHTTFTRQVVSGLRSMQGVAPRRLAKSLSGGQQQALLLSRALARKPKVLVIHEPTQGLDVGAVDSLARLLRTQAQTHQTAILLITTDERFAKTVADKRWRVHQERLGQMSRQQPRLGTAVAADDGPVPFQRVFTIPGPLIAVVLSLLLAALVVKGWGADPIQAAKAVASFAWFEPAGQRALLAHLVPLLTIAAGVAIMFRARVFSIGAQGQLYVGALTAGVVGQLGGLPGWLVAVLTLVAAALAGAIWAIPPACAHAKFRANEIVVTLIMNALGLLVTAWLVAGPFRGQGGTLSTMPINDAARLPAVLGGPGSRLEGWGVGVPIGLDLLLALTVIGLAAFVMTWTRWGLTTDYVGAGLARASLIGVDMAQRRSRVLVIGGALAGLAGGLVVLGPAGGKFSMYFSPGYGFLAITIALIGAYTLSGMVIAAFFYATLMAGAGTLQLMGGIPLAFTGLIQGVVVLTVTIHLVIPAFTFGRRLQPPLASLPASLSERSGPTTRLSAADQGEPAGHATALAGGQSLATDRVILATPASPGGRSGADLPATLSGASGVGITREPHTGGGGFRGDR